ncbi:MAG: PspC domain-containing protein [Clostridia bacterium]|nr:PspC domain-containing protein [Clostridia bacterium]
MNKKLYKSRNCMLLGVCAGVAEYFDIDPTVVRILWTIFGLVAFSGVIAYIIAAVIMPERPEAEI